MEELSLPKGWVNTALGNVLYVKNGFAFKSTKYSNTGVPIIRISDIDGYSVDTSKAVKIPKEDLYENYLIEEGDILIAMSGATTGKIGIFKTNQRAYQNQRVGNFEMYSKKYLLKPFIFYFLNMLRREIEKVAYGGAQPNISPSKIEKIRLNLAPLNEQKRIVDKIERLFSDLDEGEALLKKVQQQLTTYRQSVLKAAVTGELTKDWREKNKHRLESGEDLLKRILKSRRENWNGKGKYKEPKFLNQPYFKVPDGWSLASLEMISYRITDGTHQSPKFEDSGIPFIVIRNVKKGCIDWNNISKWVSEQTYKEYTKRCRPEKGDILYTAVGSYGIALRIKDDRKFMFQRHIAHIKPISDIGSLDFITVVLNSPITLSKAHKVARGVAQKTVTLGDLSSFQIPLPSIKEQNEIMDRINDLLSQIDTLEDWCSTELKHSNTLRQSILKDAFSGKLVPQDPKDEPASELLKRIQEDGTNKLKVRKPKKKKVS